MKHKTFIACFLFLLLTPQSVFAIDDSKYIRITNALGLSNSAINCIWQDSTHLLWLGTWDGLDVFDGKNMSVYKPEPENRASISNNIIRKIVEQRKGIIWIATDHGINRMDIYKASFSHFYFGYEKNYPALPEIYTLTKSSDNTIFSAVLDWGLSFYNETENRFQAINTPYIRTWDIKNIEIDYNDNIWILHKNGEVDIAEYEKVEEETILISKCIQLGLPPIKKLFARDNYIITLDYNRKVYVFDTKIRKKIFEYDLLKLCSYEDIIEIDIIDQTLYISPSTGSFYTLSLDLSSNPVFNDELNGIRVTSFYKCRQNILWIGTDGDGIYAFYDKKTLFHTIRLKKELNVVRSFCEDDQHRVWVATKGGGIAIVENYFTPNYKVIAEYNTNNGLSHNSVFTIVKGLGGNLFIGTDGKGIQVFSNGILSTLNTGNLPLDFTSTYAIHCSEKDSTLWIGTSEYGLIKIKIRKNKNRFDAVSFKQYLYDRNNPQSLSNNVIYSIIPDKDGSLWIGTRGGGLNHFDIEKEEFQSYLCDVNNPESLSSNDILCLYTDKVNNLWIGTSAGLNLLKNKDNKPIFFQYNRDNGLPNNTVHGIAEDNRGNIWVSTNKGIAQINKQNNQISSYYERNGLQNNEFSDGAYYKSESNNYLFFGGISGFNVFNPDQISLSSYIPDFYISSFRIFNKEENIQELIRKNKEGKDELSLNYNENFFSFNFLALDYIQNDNCEYKYKLEGVDKDWIHNGNLGYLTYTNIKPGKYVLSIYYTNSDRVWSEIPYELTILIKNPYWKTNLAYIIYFLIIAGIIYLVYLIIKRRLSQKRNLFIERLLRKEQENIHEAKLRFFTNIAHELYTPITLIYGPCEKLLEHGNSDEYVKKHLKIIKSNAERMKQLISELMEFRKVVTDHAIITPKLINVTELIKNVIHNFDEIVENNQIDFQIHIPDSDILWVSDLDSLEKILFNIISNAFKYTPREGYIHLEVTSCTDKLSLNITNSGKGIKPENINEIFNRFKILDDFENQIEKGKSGRNGIGLALTKSLVDLLKGNIKVESEVNYSTTFKIELPQLKKTDQPENCINIIPEALDYLESTPPVLQFPSGKNGSPLILIIDDEKGIRDLLIDTLSEKYDNIMEASNGREALDLMKTKRPNLIICDVIMPVMDGMEFIKEIKSNIFTNHLPVIFLSSKSSVEDQILGAQSGSDVYITKPFHPKHILAAVENILIKHNLIREYYNSSATTFELLENGKLIHQKDREFMMKVIEYIEQHINNDQLSIFLIGEALGIGEMTLYRKIKDVFDVTPSSLIKTIKMKQVTYLLLSTNYTIQEIMFRCGYNNKSYFYREFMKMYNVTPKEYKKQHNLE
ncbi:hybrid sensor histidine kinase/response regulator [Bacteroidia bacterium]|nr:hybrid sensor histidine kinase/response regulator [Bacteroidia bacterium]